MISGHRHVLKVVVVMSACVAMGSLAQRDGDEGGRSPEASAADRERREAGGVSAEALNEMLHARLDEVRETEARIQEMIEALERGAAPERVQQQWRQFAGEQLRRLGGAMREQAGRGMPERGVRRGLLDGPRRGAGEFELTEADIDEMLERMSDHRPELARRLRSAREQFPELFEAFIEKHGPRMQASLTESEGPDPREVLELALRASTSESIEERAEARAALRGIVAGEFDRRAEQAGEFIERLRARLSEAEAQLEELQERRETLIEEHVERLIERATSGELMPRRGDRGDESAEQREARREDRLDRRDRREAEVRPEDDRER